MLKNYDFAVVFGGVSNEHEISVITGTAVCNLLKRSGKSVLPVYAGRDGGLRCGEELSDIACFKSGGKACGAPCTFKTGGLAIFNKSGKPKKSAALGAVINCCHGGLGEGGALAGVCAVNRLPFVGAGLFESAAFMDKYYTKLVLKGLGVKTAKYAYIRDSAGAIAAAKKLKFPVIVKPCKLGSSIGVEKAENEEQLGAALETAFALDDGVIIEQFLTPKREINIAAYRAGGRVVLSGCEEVIAHDELLTYDDKYVGGGKRIFPAQLNKAVEDYIKNQTERVYSALNMRGLVRFDYVLKGEEAFLSEVNTTPGSLAQYLVSENYDDFAALLCSLAAEARKDIAASSEKLIISTGILDNLTVNACKVK